MLVINEGIDIGTSDVPYLKTLKSSENHTYAIAYDFSDQWSINLAKNTRTIKKNTQKLLCRTVLPLASRYRVDRVFIINILKEQC